MKKLISILLGITLLLCSCTAIDSIDIPEPSPSPTESAPPEPSPTPTPEPSFEPAEVPDNLEELSALVGVKVFSPQTLPEGYSISHLGYDGLRTAAVKYTAEAGTLLYTFTKGELDIPADAEETSIEGFPSYYIHNDLSSELQWRRSGVTYQIISEPALSFEELSALMRQMLKGPELSDDEKSVRCADMSELSELVGFEAAEPSYLPEGFKLSSLSCYRLYSAQMKYISEADTLTFRICEGDIPPAYSTKKYKDPDTADIGGMSVELFYDENGRVILAQWSSGGYTHQIFSENGASLNSIELMTVGFSR